MASLPRVVAVEHTEARVLRITFSDDLVRELDLAPMLSGYLESIDDDAAFSAVSVDPVAGTVCWPGGVDLDPDVLHGDHPSAAGSAPIVVAEYRVEQTR